MLVNKKKTINGVKYECQSLPATTGVKLFARVLVTAGPSMAAFGDGLKGIKSLSDIMATGLPDGLLTKVVGALILRIDEHEVLKLLLDILEGTVRVGPVEKGAPDIRSEVWDPDVFNIVYSANYGEMLKALLFAGEVNLAPFFDGSHIGGIFKKATTMASELLSKSESENASTPS